jgi:hypothetical protein
MYVVRLGPQDVGSRVMIRRRIDGPVPLSDVVGLLLRWPDGPEGDVVIRRSPPDAGDVEVVVALADIVAGRVVPPRPVRPHRGPGAQAPA